MTRNPCLWSPGAPGASLKGQGEGAVPSPGRSARLKEAWAGVRARGELHPRAPAEQLCRRPQEGGSGSPAGHCPRPRGSRTSCTAWRSLCCVSSMSSSTSRNISLRLASSRGKLGSSAPAGAAQAAPSSRSRDSSSNSRRRREPGILPRPGPIRAPAPPAWFPGCAASALLGSAAPGSAGQEGEGQSQGQGRPPPRRGERAGGLQPCLEQP